MIGDDLWVGANVVVHGGVTIGKGGVVNQDVAKGTLVGRVPAKLLRVISEGGANREEWDRVYEEVEVNEVSQGRQRNLPPGFD